ncbi:probable 4-coumarate--CoA ligase 1 [Culicoides brevitarsis]|uniref:probable 4-coumarate--CoA ligase 1 n=1 Tax=Culicoides brevitarsis TaxID=469753 RepID=UPI00307C570F
MSFYDEKLKIWSSDQFPPIYNPKASVGQLLLHSLKRNSSKIAEISDTYSTKYTFNDILTRSIQAANHLKACGVKKGDICSVISRNNPDLAPVMFGCFFLGATINTLDVSFDQKDLDHMLGLTEPKFIFAEEDVLVKVKVALERLELSSRIFCFSNLENIESIQNFFKNPISQEEIDDFVPTQISDTENHIGIIICSSGTTGLSKGVCLSEAVLVAQLLRAFPSISNDTILAFSSVYWITGMVTLLQGTIDGAVRINTCEPFTPEYFFKLVQKYEITRTFLTPAQIVSCLEHKDMSKANLSTLKMCMTGGSLILEDIRSRFESFLPKNAKVVTLYGMSELGACLTWNFKKIKPNSVGVLINQHSAKIIDEEGNSLSPNEKGEICIKCPYKFLGYFNNPEETKGLTDSQGWMHSGDLGYFDNDGYLFISGRKKEVIKYKNYQIAPGYIESVVQEKTGLAQICAVAVEDLKNGTDLPSVVIVRPSNFELSEKQIIEILNENLTEMKTLRGGIYFVDSLPMTPSGKVQRRIVKEIANNLYKMNKK